MRIAVVTDQYAPMVGGVPTVTRELAAGLARRGHAVTVLAPSPGPRAVRSRSGPVEVRRPGSVPWPWHEGMRVARVPVRAVRDALDAARPDVVHVHSPVVLGVLARRQAARAGIPVVYTNHYLPANVSTWQGAGSGALEAAFHGWVVGFANRCDLVSAPSATAVDLLRRNGLRTPAHAVTNGVDLAAFTPGPGAGRLRRRYRLREDLPVVLTVGRLSAEKRLDVLLAAAARSTVPAQVLVAGTGPRESWLRRRVAELGLGDRVGFTGYVPPADLPGLYRLADVFVIASEAELQSVATLEAMASGLPVVAAEAGALPELVDDGVSGLLFPAGDGTHLAACLDRLAADPGLRRAMGAQSRRIVADHGRDRALARWESLYAALGRSPSRRAA